MHCCGEEASRPIGGNIPGSPPADSGHRYISDQQHQHQQQSRARAEPASRPYCSSSRRGVREDPHEMGWAVTPGERAPKWRGLVHPSESGFLLRSCRQSPQDAAIQPPTGPGERGLIQQLSVYGKLYLVFAVPSGNLCIHYSSL